MRRKYYSLLLLVFVAINFLLPACSQNNPNKEDNQKVQPAQNNDRLEFDGIPIEGTVDDFATKMEAKGYKYGGISEKSVIRMEGKYNDNDCEIFISPSSETNLVERVVVLVFYRDGNLKKQKKDYLRLKEEHTRKYGKPTLTLEDTDDSSKKENVYVNNWTPQDAFIMLNMAEGVIMLDYQTEKAAGKGAETLDDTPTSKHNTFMGIPLDGTMDNFIDKMKERGFSLEENLDFIVVMKGKFVGETCKLFLYEKPQSKTINNVLVEFSPKKDWKSLKLEYLNIKKQCVKEYGEPAISVEKFKSPYKEGDENELQALENEKCSYASRWNVNGGRVGILINREAYISLFYNKNIER